MVKIVKIALNSFITSIFGTSLTIFSAFFIDRKPATFWSLVVVIWLVAGIINGIYHSDWKESLTAGGIIGGVIFLIVFLFIIILKIFADAILEYFSGFDFITVENLAGTSFLVGFLFALGAFLIFSSSAIATIYLKRSIEKSRGVQSTAEYESELFEKYENPQDSGEYLSTEEREEF